MIATGPLRSLTATPIPKAAVGVTRLSALQTAIESTNQKDHQIGNRYTRTVRIKGLPERTPRALLYRGERNPDPDAAGRPRRQRAVLRGLQCYQPAQPGAGSGAGRRIGHHRS